MTSTQTPPSTVNDQLNEDKKTGTFRREVLDRFSVNVIAQGLGITLVQNVYCTGSNLVT